MYFGTRCQLRTPNQTLTPHSDRRTCAISSVATPARRIDADCPRTNVAGDPTIRSSPQLARPKRCTCISNSVGAEARTFTGLPLLQSGFPRLRVICIHDGGPGRIHIQNLSILEVR